MNKGDIWRRTTTRVHAGSMGRLAENISRHVAAYGIWQ